MKNMMIVMAAGLMLVGCEPWKTPRVEALDAKAWEASEWISVKGAPVAGETEKKHQRAADGTSVFWCDIANKKAVRSAKWMTTSLGVGYPYLNGRPVGKEILRPGFTHVRKTRRSFTYDITSALEKSEGAVNRFAAEVGAGWWRDKIVNYAGQKSAFRGVIEFTYEDGTTELVGTKANEWKGAVAGPVTHAAIFDGEEYDARQTNAARHSQGKFASSGCERNDEFKGEILPSAGAEVVLREDLAIKRGPYTVKPGETLVVDFGQNSAAVPCFEFRAKRGTVLTALPGEMLNDADKDQRGCDGPKGSVYRANLRMPDDGMRIVYTFSGEGDEVYFPTCTFFGYRYLSITVTDEVEIKGLASIPVTSITKEMETGRIETGDAALNKFISNVYWGQLSNYLSVPTDCPQRNERLGWTADTQVFCETGAFNADTEAFFLKWMRDMRDSQDPRGGFPGVAPAAQYGNETMRLGWSDAGVIVPFTVWKQFGDRRIVDENWAAMEKCLARAAETKYRTEDLPECRHYQWNDWLSLTKYESCAYKPEFSAWKDGKLLPEALLYWDYLGGCYWAWDAHLMRVMADGTGRTSDAEKYATMESEAKDYLKRTFFGTGDGLIVPAFRGMQTPALFALKLGLVEGSAREKTLADLKASIAANKGRLHTGFLGTSIAMDVLVENGLVDEAYGILLGHEFPGWLYSVDQGATTVWERWNSYTKDRGFGPVGMNSFNHYAYGAVLAWIYRRSAGIAADPAKPGFKNIVMAPLPSKRLGFVKAEYRSRAGLIKSAWRYEGEKWIWDFTIPEGAKASVTLPGESAAKPYAAGTYHIER